MVGARPYHAIHARAVPGSEGSGCRARNSLARLLMAGVAAGRRISARCRSFAAVSRLRPTPHSAAFAEPSSRGASTPRRGARNPSARPARRSHRGGTGVSPSCIRSSAARRPRVSLAGSSFAQKCMKKSRSSSVSIWLCGDGDPVSPKRADHRIRFPGGEDGVTGDRGRPGGRGLKVDRRRHPIAGGTSARLGFTATPDSPPGSILRDRLWVGEPQQLVVRGQPLPQVWRAISTRAVSRSASHVQDGVGVRRLLLE